MAAIKIHPDFTAAQTYNNEWRSIFGEPYHRKLKLSSWQARPLCAHCGKPHGSRVIRETTRIIKASDLPIEQYRGNVQLAEEKLDHWGSVDGQPAARLTRLVWDGVTYYTSYSPFCTLRCALAFAQAAHRAGYRP